MGDFHVYEEFNIPLKAIANGYFDEVGLQTLVSGKEEAEFR